MRFLAVGLVEERPLRPRGVCLLSPFLRSSRDIDVIAVAEYDAQELVFA